MKITRVEFIKVRVPWREDVRDEMEKRVEWAKGGVQRYIYKVYTDDGLIGYADGPPSNVWQQLVGRSPFDFILDDSYWPLQIALYDLMGKALGLPVYRMFGPTYRLSIPVAYWSHSLSPQVLAKEVEFSVSHGFTVHKVKARPWLNIVEQIDSMAKVAPNGYQFIVDPNCTLWTASKALKVARQLEKYEILCLESPIPQQDVTGYKALRARIDIPLAIHLGGGSGSEWIPSPTLAVENGMCDYFVIEEPGAEATIRLAHVADAAVGYASMEGVKVGGKPYFVEFVGLGFTDVFGLHLAAALKNATLPSITFVFSQCLYEDDMILEQLTVKDGYTDVPKKPGLGVELDEEALRRYKVD